MGGENNTEVRETPQPRGIPPEITEELHRKVQTENSKTSFGNQLVARYLKAVWLEQLCWSSLAGDVRHGSKAIWPLLPDTMAGVKYARTLRRCGGQRWCGMIGAVQPEGPGDQRHRNRST